MKLQVRKAGKINSEISVPGDKSISHRAVMLGALAQGPTTVTNFLMGADCLSSIDCFKKMGAEFSRPDNNTIIVKGNGLYGLREPQDVLDVGNSGTTIRLMLGILAGQPFFSTVTGDASICKRPMGRVTEPLLEMGAVIDGRQNGSLAPLAVRGGVLKPIKFNSPVASAQVKSAIILAGLYARGQTEICEPHKSRDHTERMLAYLGAEIEVNPGDVKIKGGPTLSGKPVEVPGDISSAAFFMVAAAAIPGSRLIVKRVGLNPTRTGIIDVLKNMGAEITILNEDEVNGEPVGDICVCGSELKGTVIEGSLIPRLIDEIPVITVAAAAAAGETVIRDAAELKVKESNRIAVMAVELRKLGVNVSELEDGMIVQGGGSLKGAVCESHDDHRVAMSMAVAGLLATGETVIKNTGCIGISFPGFAETLAGLTDSANI
ncbi:3-phosphoshikimate 1-carboxyvinyltransferase [Phosphitispora fastidiosa]|uniref:3-phosphoshikimate 1-carboxyvinyltransferase n=1 Tax=Phosphitispora fastidiosa TaxID=2837202 RepID=UPI001E2F8E46|nr:3-phosphoshikimate 1-carboxyvinyltransferase [Phosphitispora fastidiosa]MBU7005274.1 3-phosphoshikimate 1-carboxyvinyltransferase [Phosphitispora fastidiosa]